MEEKELKRRSIKETRENLIFFVNESFEKMSSVERNGYFRNILEFKDICLSFFIILNLNYKEISIDNQGIIVLNKFLEVICADNILKKVDKSILKTNILNLMTKDVKIADFFKNISYFEINDEDIEIIINLFGYNEVFKYFKVVCCNFLEDEYNYGELESLIRIINSPKICFNTLLPIYQRLSVFVKNKHADKNIISCAKAIRAISIYSKDILLESKSSLSILSFFFDSLLSVSSYRFLSYNDNKEIVKSIEQLVEINMSNSNENLFYGLFKDTFTNIKKLSVTNILDEEFRCIAINLRLLNIFYCACYQLGIRKFDYKILFNFISKLQLKTESIEPKNLKYVLEDFLINKYEFINRVKPEFRDKLRLITMSTKKINEIKKENKEETTKKIAESALADIEVYKNYIETYNFLKEVKHLRIDFNDPKFTPKVEGSNEYIILLANKDISKNKEYENLVIDILKNVDDELILLKFTKEYLKNKVVNPKIVGFLMKTANDGLFNSVTRGRKKILQQFLCENTGIINETFKYYIFYSKGSKKHNIFMIIDVIYFEEVLKTSIKSEIMIEYQLNLENLESDTKNLEIPYIGTEENINRTSIVDDISILLDKKSSKYYKYFCVIVLFYFIGKDKDLEFNFENLSSIISNLLIESKNDILIQDSIINVLFKSNDGAKKILEQFYYRKGRVYQEIKKFIDEIENKIKRI